MARVDALRASSDAIMVGVGTVLADDPGLRVKSKELRLARASRHVPENPLRIVADSLARTPPEARILGDGCLIAVTASAPPDRVNPLSSRCEIIKCGGRQVDLVELMAELDRRGIERLMVEGGATLNWSLIQHGLVDELYTYVGSLLIGGARAPGLVDGEGFAADFPKLQLVSARTIDDGVLIRWRVEPPPELEGLFRADHQNGRG